MRRLAVLTGAVALVALAGPSPSVGALEVIARASATAVPAHGFFNHEDLVPVPILNLSLAYSDVGLEPGPSTEALASFLWDPEAAALGTIVCVLSGNQICGLPEYPFVARATHPSSGDSGEAPTLSIASPGDEFWARGVYEAAEANEDGALAQADIARLVAIPMDAGQRRAARSLARAAGSLEAREFDQDSWLIRAEAISSRSAISRGEEEAVEAFAESSIKRLELLGGLVTVRKVRGEAEAIAGAGSSGRGEAEIIALEVAGYEASIGRDGIQIDDRQLGKAELATLNEAMNDALSQVGMSFSRGSKSVERTRYGFASETWAFSLDFRRQIIPDEFPEGTQGPDVIRMPFGYARAEAARSVVEGITTDLGAPADAFSPSPAGVPAIAGEIGGSEAVLPPMTTSTDAPDQRVIAQARTAGVTSVGVPGWAIVAAALIALMFAVGLVSLRVAQVIRE